MANQPEIFRPDYIEDRLLPLLDEGELKLALFIFRQTFRFGKLKDTLSIEQLCNGIQREDGSFFNHGTGLNRRTVIKKLASLAAYGIIRYDHASGKIGTITVFLKDDGIRYDLLKLRHSDQKEIYQKRTEAVRSHRKPVPCDDTTPATTPVLCDDTATGVVGLHGTGVVAMQKPVLSHNTHNIDNKYELEDDEFVQTPELVPPTAEELEQQRREQKKQTHKDLCRVIAQVCGISDPKPHEKEQIKAAATAHLRAGHQASDFQRFLSFWRGVYLLGKENPSPPRISQIRPGSEAWEQYIAGVREEEAKAAEAAERKRERDEKARVKLEAELAQEAIDGEENRQRLARESEERQRLIFKRRRERLERIKVDGDNQLWQVENFSDDDFALAIRPFEISHLLSQDQIPSNSSTAMGAN